MSFTPGAILYIIAIVVFVAAALSVNVGGIALIPVGLACVAAGLLLDRPRR